MARLGYGTTWRLALACLPLLLGPAAAGGWLLLDVYRRSGAAGFDDALVFAVENPDLLVPAGGAFCLFLLGALSLPVVAGRFSADFQLLAAAVGEAADAVPRGVMLIDLRGRILYVNPILQKALEAAQPQIRAHDPAFDAAKLTGQGIVGLIPQCRQWFSNPNQTLLLRILFGPTCFDVRFSPVRGRSGRRIGGVVLWDFPKLDGGLSGFVEELVAATRTGDLTRRLPAIEMKEDLHRVASAVNDLMDACYETVDEAARIVEGFAYGDMGRHADSSASVLPRRMRDAAQAAAEHFEGIGADLTTTVKALREAVDGLSRDLDAVRAALLTQPAALEEALAALEEARVGLRLGSEDAGESSRTAEAARDRVAIGIAMTERAALALTQAEDAAVYTGEALALLDELAFRLHLAALNAAVAGARPRVSGDGPNGFSVETADLALRLRDALRHADTITAEGASALRDAIAMVGDCERTQREIAESVAQIADLGEAGASVRGDEADGLDRLAASLARMRAAAEDESAMVAASAERLKTVAAQGEEIERLGALLAAPGKPGQGLQPPASAAAP